MSGSQRSVAFRCLVMGAAMLLLLTTLFAAPIFTHSSAATIPFGSPAFAAQWNSIEPKVPNFWGPAYQNIFPERYQEATGGQRFVQYFDKARMEQTTANGPVTNGLLTVELMSGQRQFGDNTFVAYPPAIIPVVGDPTNTFPTYASFAASVLPAKSAQANTPDGNVYNADGTLTVNSQLAAFPGAAFGSYQTDPGGRFAHNIPLAFWSYLSALPLPWQTAMGFPLTEAVWVNVLLNTKPTWVLVQPFERRVLSYTPTNPAGFQVEMGNIGQHYYQWRYATVSNDDVSATGSATGIAMTATTTGTPSSPTAMISSTPGTPGALAISAVQIGTVSDTGFSLTFRTSAAATTEIFYGTASHSYSFHQDISTVAAQDHAVNLTGLQAGTKYYFALRATVSGTSVQGKESFFTTTGTPGTTPTATSASKPPTATPTNQPTNTPKPPTATPTAQPMPVRMTLNHVTIGAALPSLLDPSVLPLESATVALSLAYDGSSNAVADTAQPTNWVRDPTNATASSNTASSPLSLADKQTSLILTATATFPFTDTTVPPLIVTFSRKVLPSEYASGITITSPPLSNARTPGYNVTLTFAVTLG